MACAHALGDLGVEPAGEVLVGHADAQAAHASPARRLVVRDRRVEGRRVARVVPGDDREHARRAANVRRERPDLVEARRERDEAVARDAAVRRLDPDRSGERRGLADRPARVAAERARDHARRDRRGAARRGAAGSAREVPRVARRAEGAVLARRAHGELVHVRLADDHGVGRAKACDHGRVVGRHVAREDLRARRRLEPARARSRP